MQGAMTNELLANILLVDDEERFVEILARVFRLVA
jgi:hypothetical protein